MNTSTFGVYQRVAVAGLLGLGIVAAGCGGHPKGVSGEAAVDLANKDLQANQRVRAMEELWKDAPSDPSRLKIAREGAKDVLWKSSAPELLRVRALELLLTDTSPEGLADTRKFLALRMPTEAQWQLVTAMSDSIRARAGDPAWKSLSASLVRSYSRKVPVPTDDLRPERAALLALHPERDLAATVFDVFVHPAENGAPKVPDDSAEKSRQAAWELLSRIDPVGARRTVLAAGEASAEPLVRDINRCARELGVVPITGSELVWMQSLMDEKDKKNAGWWSEASSAVARLGADQRAGLRLRHLEPLRWASANRSAWMGATREQLYAELTGRLSGRKIWLNSEGSVGIDGKSHETPSDWKDKLAWGDLLSILVIDEAVHQPNIVAELFSQAAVDQADESTEYGGLLWCADQGGTVPGLARGARPAAGAIALRSCPPRATERKDDRTFIAPEEMFKEGSRAMAHYHFHVQSPQNADYAGPGKGDLDYATSQGRSCVVFTSVRGGTMDVDYYQNNGVIIDLGEISAGK